MSFTDPAFVKELNKGIVEEFRANAGQLGGRFEGGTILLLHTTGAKSGEPRLSPLAYLPIDGKMIIVGSFAGAAVNPGWVHNLRANPAASVEVGTEQGAIEKYGVVVRELPPDERDAMYPKIVALAPVFADYQASTTRRIPVFELTRA